MANREWTQEDIDAEKEAMAIKGLNFMRPKNKGKKAKGFGNIRTMQNNSIIDSVLLR
jgi:hypothetical protein